MIVFVDELKVYIRIHVHVFSQQVIRNVHSRNYTALTFTIVYTY